MDDSQSQEHLMSLSGVAQEHESQPELSSDRRSTSSSSDSEHDSELESCQDIQLQQLEATLTASPTKYEAHVEYISALRRTSQLDKLRSAREAMNALFPLNPTMWREWTQDEARLVSGGKDVSAVESLYARGVQEYLSVPLWMEFLEFKEKHDADVAQHTAEGLSKMRSLYEQALSATGLHLAGGGRIWTAYRKFEQTVLSNMVDATTEVKAKQTECIRSIFHRQLSVPLSNFAETLRDYKEWEGQQGNDIGNEVDELHGIPASVSAAYKKGAQMCMERKIHEEKIASGMPADAELLHNFLSYISLEESTGDPARCQILYERAVTEFPVTDDIWLKYTSYLETNLKVLPIIRTAYARAVRNCPWVQALWNGYLLALERSNAPELEVSAVFEQSLQSGFGFQTPSEYLDHFLTRADGLRRRICSLIDDVDKQTYHATLHETFVRASLYMSTYFPEYIDRSLQLHSYWAYIEAKLANDVVAARGVWENLIKASGWMIEVWQGYISMEISLDNIKEARTLYKRGYSRRLERNGTEMMCEAWLRFEREHGSLDDYDHALLKVRSRLTEVRQLQQQQESKAACSVAASSAEKQENFCHGKKEKRKSEQFEQDELVSKKQPVYTDECTVFLSNIPLEAMEENIREFFSSCGGLKSVRLLRNRYNGQSRGLAYVDFANEECLAAAVAKNKQKLLGRQISIARSDPTSSRNRHMVRDHGSGQRNVRKMQISEPKMGRDVKVQATVGQAQPPTIMHRRGGHVQLTGRNTFAVPRTVARPLGFSGGKGKESLEEGPKSNEEFRRILLEKRE
eukprot:c26096_g1_i2 orf=158-2560(+)